LRLSARGTFARGPFLGGCLRVELERGQIGDAIGFLGANGREALQGAERAELFEGVGRIRVDKKRVDVGGRRTVRHSPVKS
jgi:hypothetical protein